MRRGFTLLEVLFTVVILVVLVAVGEDSGSLESMLAQVAHFYDRDVEYNTKKLTTLLEPLLTAFLSVIVGFVVVSLYLPIFSLGKAIMHQ